MTRWKPKGTRRRGARSSSAATTKHDGINISDNRLGELPGPDGNRYDDDELAVLLSYLEDDYAGTGWTAEDVEKLIGVPDFEPEDDSPRLDELEPRFCPKCGYDTANDPEALKVRPG